MGINSKNCKVTVHLASTKTSPYRSRRQTVGEEGVRTFRHHPLKLTPPLVSPCSAYTTDVNLDIIEFQEDDTANIAVLSEDETLASSRHRAYTTSSLSTSSRLSNILNPLSRLTMRWTEQSTDAKSNKAMAASTTSTSTTPDLMDSPPPLMTPPPLMDTANSFLDVDTEDSADMMRPTFEDALSLIAGTPPIPAGLTLDMLPTKFETPPIPSHLRDVLLHKQRSLSQPELEDSKEDTYSENEDDENSSFTAQNYDDLSSEHSVNTDSIGQTSDQTEANFVRDSNPFDQLYGTPEALSLADGLGRSVCRLSSPRKQNEVTRPRKATVPDNSNASSSIHRHDYEVSPEPMYHGQELHLVFKLPNDQIIQVQGQPKGRIGGHENPFSRRVRCHEVGPHGALDDSDTLRIIGHTIDGMLRGGDCVSFARLDGKVLRMQSMSKKLAFSSKIDVRAKFVITGVPDRTPVTSTSKFYLQSLYDRRKTVGFLPSRRENQPGCLAMYVLENTNDKVKPIRFIKHYPRYAWH